MDGIKAIVLQPLYDIVQGAVVVVLFVAIVLPALFFGLIKSHIKLTRATSYGLYQCLEGWPSGKWMYTRLVAVFAPYSGSIYACVENLEPGSATVSMQDRPWLRNPFKSVHALALANCAEMATGLVGVTAIEAENGRCVGIPVSLSVKYVAKARGTVTCHSKLPEPIPKEPGTYPMDLSCDVVDSKGVVVAHATVGWSFRVRESKKKQ